MKMCIDKLPNYLNGNITHKVNVVIYPDGLELINIVEYQDTIYGKITICYDEITNENELEYFFANKLIMCAGLV